jgi:hypothetical protein
MSTRIDSDGNVYITVNGKEQLLSSVTNSFGTGTSTRSYATSYFDYEPTTTYTLRRPEEVVHNSIDKELKKLENYLILESLIKPK